MFSRGTERESFAGAQRGSSARASMHRSRSGLRANLVQTSTGCSSLWIAAALRSSRSAYLRRWTTGRTDPA